MGNKEPQYLGRAFDDGKHSCVPPVTMDIIFIDITVSTMDLNGSVAYPLCHLRREKLCLCGFAGNVFSFVPECGGMIREEPRSLNFRRHVCNLLLNKLKIPDTLAKGLPLPAVR